MAASTAPKQRELHASWGGAEGSRFTVTQIKKAYHYLKPGGEAEKKRAKTGDKTRALPTRRMTEEEIAQARPPLLFLDVYSELLVLAA